jgi:epsilon-lactone hydrolase
VPYPPIDELREVAALVKSSVLASSLAWPTQRTRMAAMLMAVPIPEGTTWGTEAIGGVPCEVHRPSDGPAVRTLLLVHGGGFCVGTPQMSRAWAAALCTGLGARVVLPDYPLSPEAAPGAALAAVQSAYDALVAEGPIGLLGDSAGANLALAVAQARVGSAAPAALVLCSPWLDLAADRRADAELVARDPMLSPDWLEACAEAYAPGRLAEPWASPLAGELSGLPPALVIGGTDDLLAPDVDRLVESWAGPAPIEALVVESMWHDFALQVGLLEAADEALATTIEFLGGLLGTG